MVYINICISICITKVPVFVLQKYSYLYYKWISKGRCHLRHEVFLQDRLSASRLQIFLKTFSFTNVYKYIWGNIYILKLENIILSQNLHISQKCRKEPASVVLNWWLSALLGFSFKIDSKMSGAIVLVYKLKLLTSINGGSSFRFLLKEDSRYFLHQCPCFFMSQNFWPQ